MSIANLFCCALSLLPCHDRGYQSTISGQLFLQTDVVIQSELQRPRPPIVVIPNAIPGSGISGEELSSADLPAFSSLVPYRPLTVEVRVPSDRSEAMPENGVQLFLDGHAVDRSRFKVIKPEVSIGDDGNSISTFEYGFDCPAPGKHVLQARYLNDNVWSRLSPPLYFEIAFPPTPKIIAISDSGNLDVGGPITDSPVKITSDSIRINLANVGANDSLLVYIDGKKIGPAKLIGSCCFEIAINGSIVPGVHDLAVRTTSKEFNCPLASQASDPVQIHYFVESDYVTNSSSGIGPTQTPGDQLALTSPNGKKTGGEEIFRFQSAAHFPRRAFDQNGNLIERQGAFIYEGMEITQSKGNFLLNFQLGTPSVPTTLNLQLQVQMSAGEPWYTITLPPMHFPENEHGSHGVSDQSWAFKSAILKQFKGHGLKVRRTGSARFGFGVAGLGHPDADSE